jgi:hypothetical protein
MKLKLKLINYTEKESQNMNKDASILGPIILSTEPIWNGYLFGEYTHMNISVYVRSDLWSDLLRIAVKYLKNILSRW